MHQDLKGRLEQNKGWDYKYLTKTTKASKTYTHAVSVHTIWDKGSRLDTALNSESLKMLQYERNFGTAEYTPNQTEHPAVQEPLRTLVVLHFQEWLGFTVADWHGMTSQVMTSS
jgi:hypothetical protein